MIESVEMERNPELSRDVPKLLNVTENDRFDVLKRYNVSSKGLQDIIYSIQEWYEKQPHLPKGKLDNHMIFQHLMLKGFSIEEVKDKIDNCVSAKRKMPEILLNRDPLEPRINEYLKFGFLVVLPKKTPRNHRVTIFRIKQPIDLVASDVVKIASMFLAYRMYNDSSLGEQWIFDLTNVSFHNSVQMTPALLTKLIFYLRFCYGAKIKGIHFVNMPSFIIPIINILKKLMKPKVAKRIYVYSSFNDLNNLISKTILPKEYGGDEITCDEITENWRKALQSDAWIEYFAEEDKVMSDEALRTRILNSDDFFGLEGSFRKLEVD
ncbi:PREDICTED: alpha-tocopherol transfer protein-like [Papilio xuthus]|uniref:Alpha-tocopherol transfer protein-like n=1 Tax=Papilio xuthus TaxID=66420 RepID=A0AAJ7E8Z6_PAPXU|nr:PREDICTED: alpha-tocopherol transfer protein-like [Papilio xuthus]